ncbi:hypothetical protein EYF80_046726 [Liparis tanakae]|uniref:Uncharacterized protein n=1 Tax=Liparis tanakae TaxID=230148 RepID=A0A4Z2FRT3_9TELE|nr:hypothetical protein EYF80_046726 [Liparis tanakae]
MTRRAASTRCIRLNKTRTPRRSLVLPFPRNAALSDVSAADSDRSSSITAGAEHTHPVFKAAPTVVYTPSRSLLESPLSKRPPPTRVRRMEVPAGWLSRWIHPAGSGFPFASSAVRCLFCTRL